MKLIYLASPYSHPDATVRYARYRMTAVAAAYLMQAGHNVFSPICHTHPIAELGCLSDRDASFWLERDKQILAFCDEVRVLKLEGWENSKGIAHELAWAKEMGKPCTLMEPVQYCTAHKVWGDYCKQCLQLRKEDEERAHERLIEKGGHP